MQSSTAKSGKRVYSSPQWTVYGDLRTITATVGNKGFVSDGGMGSTDKTS